MIDASESFRKYPKDRPENTLYYT